MKLIKTWDNREQCRIRGNYNGWTHRIFWYEEPGGGIRLRLETANVSRDIRYREREQADFTWNKFKEYVKNGTPIQQLWGAPDEAGPVPVVQPQRRLSEFRGGNSSGAESNSPGVPVQHDGPARNSES